MIKTITYLLIIIVTLYNNLFAQEKIKNPKAQKAIEEYIEIVKMLNEQSSKETGKPHEFHPDETQIIYGDINGDENEDVVLNFIIRSKKKDSIQPIGFLIGALVKQGSEYIFIKPVPFAGFMKLTGHLAEVKLKEVNQGKVYVEAFRWGYYDENCCPSIKEEYYFSFNAECLIINKSIPNFVKSGAKIGSVVTFGNVKYQVNNIELKKNIGNVYYNISADGVYLIVNMTLTNMDRESQSIANGMFKVYTSDNYEYGSASEASAPLVMEGKNPILLENIPPKIPKQFSIAFEIPVDSDIYSLRIWNGWYSDKYIDIILEN